MIDKAREVALKVLYKIDKDNAYSNIALDEELKKNKKSLNEKDIGLISEIVYGTTTWRLTIDEIIKKYSKIKIKKISTWILNILRMGIYQIVFLDKIPKSASVNESVNLAKRYGHKSSSNFVNAILRKVEKKDLKDFNNIENNIEKISKTTSMPEWIVKELLHEFSEEDVKNICINSNIKPKTSIRINKLKTSKKELLKILKEKNIEVEEGILEDFLVLNKVKNIENMSEFKNGLFTIQDEAAGLIPLVLSPKQNEKVLDACSSPGGKTTYIAEIMQNNGQIDAWDIHEHRVKLVENAKNRLGINIINEKVNNAELYNEEYKEKYDKILLDVPCMGIGVIKRKPDIKWQRKKEDIAKITKIQKNILQTCSKYIKTGGSIVYSTCSILKQENENIIKDFIKSNTNFVIEEIESLPNSFFNKYIKENKYICVQPNKITDGFFICKLCKKF